MFSARWFGPPMARRRLPAHVQMLFNGFGLLCLLLLVACVSPKTPPPLAAVSTATRDAIAPESASGRQEGVLTRASRQAVAAANPYASQAGIEILRAGGNAIDAAIAMELVLGLVEPQSSGLGGGAFLLHFDAREKKLSTWDGRETAPASISPTLFLDTTGKPRDYLDAVVGGQSVGVPGLLRMLETVHQKYGKLPWKRLFEPALQLSTDGFNVSPRLHSLIKADPLLGKMASSKAYFFTPEGLPLPIGTRLKNPEMAEVLRTVAERGADAFYTGPIAEDIVNAVQNAERNPGSLSLADMAGYQPKERPPVCAPWNPRGQKWQVCGMGPPSSGGIAVLQILQLLEPFELSKRDPDAPETTHLYAEANRLAFADRAQYLADPDYVEVPVTRLLDPTYLKQRSSLIAPGKTLGQAPPGEITVGMGPYAPDRSLELPATSHLVVMDSEGNVVSMTATVEAAFGSRLMVRGFLLNNELTDFSFFPDEKGKPIANRLEPGKRPRSSMAPTIVLDHTGKSAVMALGSPGGSQIISYVTRTLLSVGEWGMDLNTAISRPHVVNRNGVTELEPVPGFEGWLDATTQGLKARGHDVQLRELNSGVQGILRTPAGLEGAADPRREGVMLGD